MRHIPEVQSPFVACLNQLYKSSLASLEASSSCLTRSAASLNTSSMPMIKVLVTILQKRERCSDEDEE